MDATEVKAPALPGNLKREMTQRGLSVRGLADKSGVNKATLNRWRQGSTTVRIDAAENVAAALGISASSLLGQVQPGTAVAPPPPSAPAPPAEHVRIASELADLAD